MARMNFADKLSLKLEELENLVSAEYVSKDQHSYETANMIANGYIKSFLINMLSEGLSKKAIIETVNDRISYRKTTV